MYYDRLRTVPGREKSLQAFRAFSGMFDSAFIRGRGIDFGCLDVKTQLDILKRCLQSTCAVQEWKESFPSQTKLLIAALHSTGRVRAGDAVMAGTFEKSFTQCYFGKHRSARLTCPPDPKTMLRYFCRLEHFRPLMTPERADDAAS